MGGAESRVMDLYRHMDREKIEFDFLVTRGTKDYYSDEIRSLGGNVYYLPPFRIYNYFEYISAVKSFFEEHKGQYAAVHGHMTSTACMYLPIAKKSGVKLTIAHARSAGVDPGIKGILTKVLRHNLYKRCDMLISCSDEASVSAFEATLAADGKTYISGDKNVHFMPNAIDTADFAYNDDNRIRIREKYGVGADDILIGHVGSFRYAKNHEWIVNVFARVNEMINSDDVDVPEHLRKKKCKLMLVGEGELRTQIMQLVKEKNLEDSVIFTGNQSPVAPFYHAFDALLFPSHYEGMPGTVVESQAAGLPTLMSTAITKQCICTDLVLQMSLDEDDTHWAGALLSILDRRKKCQVIETVDGCSLQDTYFDVAQQVRYYVNLYITGKSK